MSSSANIGRRKRAAAPRERTVTTLTEDPYTHLLVPTPSEEPAHRPRELVTNPSPFAVPITGPHFSSAHHYHQPTPQSSPQQKPAGGANTSNSPMQQQPAQSQPQNSPGKSDLDTLERLKQSIKSGQHPQFSAVPQPAALASLLRGAQPEQQQPQPPQTPSNINSASSPVTDQQAPPVAQSPQKPMPQQEPRPPPAHYERPATYESRPRESQPPEIGDHSRPPPMVNGDRYMPPADPRHDIRDPRYYPADRERDYRERYESRDHHHRERDYDRRTASVAPSSEYRDYNHHLDTRRSSESLRHYDDRERPPPRNDPSLPPLASGGDRYMPSSVDDRDRDRERYSRPPADDLSRRQPPAEYVRPYPADHPKDYRIDTRPRTSEDRDRHVHPYVRREVSIQPAPPRPADSEVALRALEKRESQKQQQQQQFQNQHVHPEQSNGAAKSLEERLSVRPASLQERLEQPVVKVEDNSPMTPRKLEERLSAPDNRAPITPSTARPSSQQVSPTASTVTNANPATPAPGSGSVPPTTATVTPEVEQQQKQLQEQQKGATAPPPQAGAQVPPAEQQRPPQEHNYRPELDRPLQAGNYNTPNHVHHHGRPLAHNDPNHPPLAAGGDRYIPGQTSNGEYRTASPPPQSRMRDRDYAQRDPRYRPPPEEYRDVRRMAPEEYPPLPPPPQRRLDDRGRERERDGREAYPVAGEPYRRAFSPPSKEDMERDRQRARAHNVATGHYPPPPPPPPNPGAYDERYASSRMTPAADWPYAGPPPVGYERGPPPPPPPPAPVREDSDYRRSRDVYERDRYYSEQQHHRRPASPPRASAYDPSRPGYDDRYARDARYPPVVGESAAPPPPPPHTSTRRPRSPSPYMRDAPPMKRARDDAYPPPPASNYYPASAYGSEGRTRSVTSGAAYDDRRGAYDDHRRASSGGGYDDRRAPPPPPPSHTPSGYDAYYSRGAPPPAGGGGGYDRERERYRDDGRYAR